VLFDEDEALAQFSAVQNELQQTAERQRVAQNELIQAASKLQIMPRASSAKDR
jgi:hypothetical protein